MKVGVHYAKGRTGAMAEAMLQLFKDIGGKVHLSTEINRIIMKNKQVAGLALNTGEKLEAEIVISNADSAFTYMHMIDKADRPALRLKSVFKNDQADNPKVNLAFVADKLFALGETRIQVEIDSKTLASKGIYNYETKEHEAVMTTAHPYVEGDIFYNMLLKMGSLNTYNIIAFDSKNNTTKRLCRIPTARPSYVHSIGKSEKYFILLEYPFTCRSIDLLLFNRAFIKNFCWHPKKSTIMRVIDATTGKLVHKQRFPPFFSFHFVNAFDTTQGVTFDLIAYPNADVIDSFYLDNMRNLSNSFREGQLERFTINFKRKTY